MRLSTIIGDPGYHPYASFARIFLDGVERFGGAVTADEEAGLIVLVERGKDGKLLVEDGQIVTREQYGEVKVMLPREVEMWTNHVHERRAR